MSDMARLAALQVYYYYAGYQKYWHRYPIYDVADLPVGMLRIGMGDKVGAVPSMLLSGFTPAELELEYILACRFQGPDGTRALIPSLIFVDSTHPEWFGKVMSSIIQVEFAGLGGDHSYLNGIHRLIISDRKTMLWQSLSSGARWRLWLEGDDPFEVGGLIYYDKYTLACWYDGADYWHVQIHSQVDSTSYWNSEYCYKQWRMAAAPGTLADGSYSEHNCGDGDCANTNTCELSEGATCVVSKSSPLFWDE